MPKQEQSIPTEKPRYGEVWSLTRAGDESGEWLGVVVSTDAVGLLPWRIVARVERQGKPVGLWQVPTPELTDLEKGVFVDTAQLSTVETDRWGERVGRLSAASMDEVAAAIAILVEFDEGG